MRALSGMPSEPVRPAGVEDYPNTPASPRARDLEPSRRRVRPDLVEECRDRLRVHTSHRWHRTPQAGCWLCETETRLRTGMRRMKRHPNGCMYRGEEEMCSLCGAHWDEAPTFCPCNEPAPEPSYMGDL